MYTKRMFKRFYILTFLFIASMANTSYSQEGGLHIIPDSLLNKSDEYLLEQARKNYNDTTKIVIYYSSLLARANINNDAVKRAQALSYLAYFQKEKSKKIEYIETAISESEGREDIDLIRVYNTAGIIYYNIHEYETSLNQYLKTLELSEKHNSNNTKYVALVNIANIKLEIGKYGEALVQYKRSLAYEDSRSIKDSLSIMIIKVGIAESMRYLKKHDSTSYYYHQIINKPFNDPYFHIYRDIATINEGINLFNQQKYTEAKKLLESSSSRMNISTLNQKYYILSQFYLGKINLALTKNEALTEDYFYKVDSLLTITNSVIPETREVYDFFIKKHKLGNELLAQIKAINKHIAYDSIINARKINTIDKLHSEFDIPELLKSKETAIQLLEESNSTLSNTSIYLTTSIFILVFLFIFQYRKHKVYKKRFNELISESNSNKKDTEDSSVLKNTSPKELNIDEKLVSKILEQLNDFEKNHLYTKRDITISSLAKTFSTNTRYLSKVINLYKEKKFIHYINDLRIEYILEELKTNTILQRYTVKSISEEAGFNTAESFATAFKKKTGIKPSYFIRNLKKREVI